MKLLEISVAWIESIFWMGFSRLAQHQAITKAAAKAAIQARCLTTFIYVAVFGTVTVPLCPFKLPGQLFPLLVPVVRPDKEDSSVMRGWGRGCGGHGSGWNPWGHRSPSQTSHNTLQRSATGAFMSQSETYSRIAFITTSYSHIHKYFNLSLSHLWHPRCNHTLTYVQMCLAMSSWENYYSVSIWEVNF